MKRPSWLYSFLLQFVLYIAFLVIFRATHSQAELIMDSLENFGRFLLFLFNKPMFYFKQVSGTVLLYLLWYVAYKYYLEAHTIRVRRLTDGQTGRIPKSEFDPRTMEEL